MSEVEPVQPAQETPKAGEPSAQPNPPGQADVAAPAPTEPKPTSEAAEIKYDLKLPDNSGLEPKALEDIAAFAKQHRMSNEQAQELVARESQTKAQLETRQQEQLKAQVTAWEQEVRNDKDLGGEKFGENSQIAKRFVDRFGSPELKKALDDTGLGNHPALFKLCLEAGRAMKDDKMVFSGSQSSDEHESPASVLYGKTHK